MPTFMGMEVCPMTGVETRYFYDEQTDGIIVERWQDVEPILDLNKANKSERPDFKHTDNWHAASIPGVVLEKWKNEDGLDFFNQNHLDGIAKRLNDSEFRDLRTGDFKL
jgi:hypothetical protein